MLVHGVECSKRAGLSRFRLTTLRTFVGDKMYVCSQCGVKEVRRAFVAVCNVARTGRV